MIKLDNMSFHYKSNELFNSLSADIKGGSVYGLLGKNGAGKTTLLKIICGLISAKSGQLIVNDSNPEKREPDFLSKTYFIPEDFALPRFSGATYLKLFAPFYPDFNVDSFLRYSAEFEIDPYKCANLMTMSFGQRKKFLIAFGFAANTPLLILDEPANGLDIPSRRVFRNMLNGLLKSNRTVIVSTHQVKDLEQSIDALVILENGKILLNSSIELIQSKFSFENNTNFDNAENVIYKESVPGGFAALVKKSNDVQSQIDMELLFNAVLTSHDSINSYLYL